MDSHVSYTLSPLQFWFGCPQEIFYHQGQGFLEYRLKTIRLGVPTSSKKRKLTVSKEKTEENTGSSAEDTPAIIEKVNFHIYLHAGTCNLHQLQS